jgi:HEAT repeat protein
LQAPARGRRLRALEAAAIMEMIEELEDAVVPLLSDEDHMVRAEAARALAQCSTERARLVLREALLDRSVAVRNAAEQSLETLAVGPARRKEAIDLGAISLPEQSLAST